MSSIHFFQEDIRFEPEHWNILTDWIQSVVTQNKQKIESINFIYCSDNYLLEINKSYLDHDYYTDIITFDNRADPFKEPLDADIFISVDRVRDNAQQLDQSFSKELHRVMIHGILHLLGQSDKTESEQKEMRKREEASLSLLKI